MIEVAVEAALGATTDPLVGETKDHPVGPTLEADDPVEAIVVVPFSVRHPRQLQAMVFNPMSLGLVEWKHQGRVLLGVACFIPKDIQASDRVVFARHERDRVGLPQLSLRYRLTDRDNAALSDGLEDQRRAAGILGRMISRQLILPAGSSKHYQGTVRMGQKEDGTSVCDSYGRVWGTENLFVGGNGVIATSTAGNPTLTSVALAVRGAETVVRTLMQL
jgi:choline dehydrogenase-like flavoprotein